MTSAADEFEDLFDEVAAQRSATVAATPQASDAEPAPAVESDAPAHESDHAVAGESASPSDKPMFERLGGIVRMLHDSLRELGYGRSLSSVAT